MKNEVTSHHHQIGREKERGFSTPNVIPSDRYDFRQLKDGTLLRTGHLWPTHLSDLFLYFWTLSRSILFVTQVLGQSWSNMFFIQDSNVLFFIQDPKSVYVVDP